MTDALGEALLPRVQWTPPDLPGRNDSWRDGPACISMNASIDDGSSSTRRRLSGVECDYANRVAVLARHQIGDDGFKIGPLDVGLGKAMPRCPKLLPTR